MVDITKCEGGNCPLKQGCYRYTAPSEPLQSYTSFEVSYTGERNCKDFINNNGEPK